jgi:hypothetical protein
MSATENSGSLRILWREGYEAARDEAQELGRPMLLVMVAGELGTSAESAARCSGTERCPIRSSSTS